MGHIPLLSDNQMKNLGRIIGTNQKLNLTVSPKGKNRRYPTYSEPTTKVVANEYTGMFKLNVEMEENKTDTPETDTPEKDKKYYLNITWPDSNYTSKTLVGLCHEKKIYWMERMVMTDDCDIYIDPFGGEIKICKLDDKWFSSYILIGNYSNCTHAVTQVLRSSNSVVMENAYPGPFVIRANEDGVCICRTLYDTFPFPSDSEAGSAYVNNVYFDIPVFCGSLPGIDTVYYIRHTSYKYQGWEDEDLSDERRLELRTFIATCDANIKQYAGTVAATLKSISDLYKDITERREMITIIDNKFNSLIGGKRSEKEAAVYKIQSQISALNQFDPEYETKINKLNAEIWALISKLQKDISEIENKRYREILEVKDAVSEIYDQIFKMREESRLESKKITDENIKKNAFCLELYGIVPTDRACCEIVELPYGTNTSQTDQYLFYPIATIQQRYGLEYYISQISLTGNINLYRTVAKCGDLLL